MYREVTMFEVTEALRLWLSGTPKKRIAAQLGLDPKTVRHYVAVGTGVGLQPGAVLTEEHVRAVLLALQPSGGRPRGDTWSHCVAQREAIQRWLRQGVRLSKIRKLLARTGVAIPYPTLHRFAVLELQCGRTASTIPVADGEAGKELQVDTGWVGWLTLPLLARTRRRFRAWIFTAVYSRYRFVYPTFEETTARAIEACEAPGSFSAAPLPSSFPITPRRSSSIPIRSPPGSPQPFWSTRRRGILISTPHASGILATYRCGASRRSRAISSPASPRRSIRCRIDTWGTPCRRGPISSSCASTNGGC